MDNQINYIDVPAGLDIHFNNSELPKFYIKEFNKISEYIGQKNDLIKEELEDIRNFSALIFKSLYLTFHDYPYELDIILSNVYLLFGFRYEGEGKI